MSSLVSAETLLKRIDYNLRPIRAVQDTYQRAQRAAIYLETHGFSELVRTLNMSGYKSRIMREAGSANAEKYQFFCGTDFFKARALPDDRFGKQYQLTNGGLLPLPLIVMVHQDHWEEVTCKLGARADDGVIPISGKELVGGLFCLERTNLIMAIDDDLSEEHIQGYVRRHDFPAYTRSSLLSAPVCIRKETNLDLSRHVEFVLLQAMVQRHPKSRGGLLEVIEDFREQIVYDVSQSMQEETEMHRLTHLVSGDPTIKEGTGTFNEHLEVGDTVLDCLKKEVGPALGHVHSLTKIMGADVITPVLMGIFPMQRELACAPSQGVKNRDLHRSCLQAIADLNEHATAGRISRRTIQDLLAKKGYESRDYQLVVRVRQ